MFSVREAADEQLTKAHEVVLNEHPYHQIRSRVTEEKTSSQVDKVGSNSYEHEEGGNSDEHEECSNSNKEEGSANQIYLFQETKKAAGRTAKKQCDSDSDWSV
jgi:hypothetical protein